MCKRNSPDKKRTKHGMCKRNYPHKNEAALYVEEKLPA